MTKQPVKYSQEAMGKD
jgi:nicotinamidase-related amidase